jgi:pre-mRNA-processing factor 6
MFSGYKPSAKGPGRGYVAGRGRGASGFQTRSDLGNTEDAASASANSASGASNANTGPSPWGSAPTGYVAGAGRGASKMGAGDNAAAAASSSGGAGPTGQPHQQPQQQQKYQQRNQPAAKAANVEGQYDDDDHEADLIWAAIDERLQSRRKKKRKTHGDGLEGPAHSDDPRARERAKIQHSFRDVKEDLANVSEEAWMNIPDAMGDHSLKHKRAQEKKNGRAFITPLSDSLLEARTSAGRSGGVADTKSSMALNATVNADGGGVNMSGIGAARGTVLGMSLDRMSTSATESGLATSVNASGYLTSMSTIDASGVLPTNLGDIHKARLLLKSVRDTNPGHGQGWIASARVEEAAGKTLRARKLIQEGCAACPTFVDVWLEAARLHPLAVAKSILATAVRRVDNTIPLFLKAAELETDSSNKKAVLRKALEANPHSLQLWKHAIGLEDTEEGAKILLAVAVEKVPTAIELWLALARLETYKEAQSTLNKARKALPLEKSIWMAAAKLEESQNHLDRVPKIVDKAFRSLSKKEVIITRQQWITEAEDCETAGAPTTSAFIVTKAIGLGVLDEDKVRTWSDDAKQVWNRGSVATARAILAHALKQFPTKRSLWMQAVELEKKSHNQQQVNNNDDANETKEINAMNTTTATITTNKHVLNEALDQVLQAASERLPRVEVFWLLRAKEQWLAGFVDVARDILAKAFEANPDSETVWLAAAKLEWENGETERARVLLERARERAPSERVFMKSALLEREVGDTTAALKLIEEGLQTYPTTARKLYMMGGQICSDDLPKALLSSAVSTAKNGDTAKIQKKLKSYLDKARKIYQEGIEKCKENNVSLWILASRLEERAHTFLVASEIGMESSSATSSSQQQQQQGVTKARSLMELARLHNPKNDQLWLEATRLERRSGNPQLADSLQARALQECPKSGALLAEHITTAPRVAQKGRSASAIKRNPESPLVIAAVAALFATDKKIAKARKWFERAVLLDPDLGDSWAKYYAFERQHGTSQQQLAVKERCARAEPNHGELWQATTKDMANRHKTVEEGLELVVIELAVRKAKPPPSK